MDGLPEAANTYNLWFISAIKSSIVDGDVDEKKLVQNCQQCFNQVSSTIKSRGYSGDVYDEFRLNSTILLLLSSPIVRSLHLLQGSEDITPLIQSVPCIEESKIASVLKSLKNYRYLSGILPWLPCSVSCRVLQLFCKYPQTPLSLAFNFEIVFNILYTAQFNCIKCEDVKYSLSDYIEFLKSKSHGEEEKNLKLAAYYLFYIVEAMHMCFKVLYGSNVEEPHSLSLGLKFKFLSINQTKSVSSELSNVLSVFSKELLQICNEFINNISINSWIEWHSINSPDSGMSFFKSRKQECVQQELSHTIYKILKINSSSSRLQEYQALWCFFNQVAVDPDYDPDLESSVVQLIEKIRSGDNIEKLMSLLLTREDILNDADCLQCVKDYGGLLTQSDIIPITKIIVDHLKTNESIVDGWKRAVIELCKKLPISVNLELVNNYLDKGRSHSLKTDEFVSDLTQVFNQLSNQNDEKCYDLYVWLCLQSGREVVRYSVEMAFSLPALVSVIAPGLKNIPMVCRAKTEHGHSLLTKEFLEKIDLNLTTKEKGNGFEDLVLNILESFDPSNTQVSWDSEKLCVNLQEILELIIFPRLKYESKLDERLLSILNILTRILPLYPPLFVEEWENLACLISSLVLLMNNCSTLHDSDFALALKVRQSVSAILQQVRELMENMDSEIKGKVTELIKKFLFKYELHPRSLQTVSWLISKYPKSELGTSLPSNLFSVIVESAVTSGTKGYVCVNGELNEEVVGSGNIPIRCSRMDWIWSLYAILPDCSELEWAKSICFTHSFKDQNPEITNGNKSVISTLDVYLDLLLLCSNGVHQFSESDSEDRRNQSGHKKLKQVSLKHCFKAFSNSVLVFLKTVLKNEPKFTVLAEVFVWWCENLRCFDCDLDLLCLLLNCLISELIDLAQSDLFSVASPPAKKQKKKRKKARGVGAKRDRTSGIEDGCLQESSQIGRSSSSSPDHLNGDYQEQVSLKLAEVTLNGASPETKSNSCTLVNMENGICTPVNMKNGSRTPVDMRNPPYTPVDIENGSRTTIDMINDRCLPVDVSNGSCTPVNMKDDCCTPVNMKDSRSTHVIKISGNDGINCDISENTSNTPKGSCTEPNGHMSNLVNNIPNIMDKVETITPKKFDEIVQKLTDVFISSVGSCQLASTIASKIQTLSNI